MIQNYLKPAWRNLTKSKTFSFINIFGLAAAMKHDFLRVLAYTRAVKTIEMDHRRRVWWPS